MSSTLMPGLDSSRSTCFIACLLARPRAAASPCPMAATASEAPCITPRVASHRLSMRLACRSAPSTPPSTWRTSLNENWLVMVALMTGSAAFGSWLRSRFGRWGPAKSGSAKTHDLNAGVAHSILFGIPSGRADSFIPTPSKAQNEGMPEAPRCWHLIVRREVKSEKTIKYTLSNAAVETPPLLLAQMQGQRYRVERSFEDAKDQCGLADYQVLGWRAWHHHVTMVMLAMLFIAEQRVAHQPGLALLTPRDIVE